MAALMPGSSAGRGLLSPKERRDTRVRLGLTLGSLLLLAVSLLTVAPVAWMILGSFRSAAELYAVPQTFWPGAFSLDNYRAALRLMPFGLYLVNSLILCLGAVLGQVMTAAMAGYALSKLHLRAPRAWLLVFLTSLMVPAELLVLPQYLIMRSFPFGPGAAGVNLLDTYAGLVLPSLFSAFAVFVAKDAMDAVPKEILDAARLDGCGEWKVFWRIALPMAKPALAILAVFAFVTNWNSFFWPLIVVSNPDFYPLMLGLQKLIDGGEPLNVVLAALSLATLPSLLLLAFFQRTLVRGIAYTGLFG